MDLVHFSPDPSVWGPTFWRTIHAVAIHYPDSPTPEHADAARAFFYALRYLLPCPGCRVGIAKMVDAEDFEPALKSQRDLFAWTVKAHNAVNVRTGKRVQTVDEVLIDDHARYVKYFNVSRAPRPIRDVHARVCAASPYAVVAWQTASLVLALIVLVLAVRFVSRQRRRSSLPTCGGSAH